MWSLNLRPSWCAMGLQLSVQCFVEIGAAPSLQLNFSGSVVPIDRGNSQCSRGLAKHWPTIPYARHPFPGFAP